MQFHGRCALVPSEQMTWRGKPKRNTFSPSVREWTEPVPSGVSCNGWRQQEHFKHPHHKTVNFRLERVTLEFI